MLQLVKFELNLFRVGINLRSYSSRYYDKREGIAFPGGYKYYPRTNNQEDPPIEAAKLFMVKRIKPIKGNPYWEKNILKQLKLDGTDLAVIKNIPENNSRLWAIKHLIKITPIQFPNGEPTEEDISHTYLRENGDLIIRKELSTEKITTREDYNKDNVKMDGLTLRRQSRLKWLSGW